MPASATAGPLAGLRVIEVSSYVAAPLAGMTMAQLGAEVIRIDPIGGASDVRRWPLAPGGTSLYWTGLNKGKQSVEVNLRAPEGRHLVSRLIAESGPGGGIVLTNAGADWLSYPRLVRRRSDLIHVRILGMPDGAPAVDYTVNAQLGFPLITGPPGSHEPVNHVLPAWDVACGLYACIALLGAERRRRQTGVGSELSVSLYDVALATAGNLGYLAEAQLGSHRPAVGNHIYGTFGRSFVTADDQHVMIVALTARHWRDLLDVTGTTVPVAALQDALGVDFDDDGTRYTYREALGGLLATWFSAHDLAAVSAALSQTSVLWSRYRSFTDLAANGAAQLRNQPLMTRVNQPGVGELLAPRIPITDHCATLPVTGAPPLGEHTDAVLQRLGIDAEQLLDLRAAGVLPDLKTTTATERLR